MTGAFIVALSAATYSQEPGAPPISNTNVVLVTTIIGFLTLIATNVFALWRESRNRKWDQEDREIARINARVEQQRTAGALAAVVKDQHEELKSELVKNTEITQEVGAKAVAAIDSANNFNAKLTAYKEGDRRKGI